MKDRQENSFLYNLIRKLHQPSFLSAKAALLLSLPLSYPADRYVNTELQVNQGVSGIQNGQLEPDHAPLQRRVLESYSTFGHMHGQGQFLPLAQLKLGFMGT